MHKNNIRVLFICPYPIGESPSQRFRFEQYFDLLKHNGFSVVVKPFMSLATWRIIYQPGNTFNKIAGVFAGFYKRLIALAQVPQFDFVFIHREATPVGPPWFEWIVAKVFQKKIIYDFDDAIWLPATSKENLIASKLRWHTKVKSICTSSYRISCGNSFLVEYAKKFNHRAILNPTTIDTRNHHNPDSFPSKGKHDRFVIGWTGTHSTLQYLDHIVPVIQSLEKKFPNQFEFRVIADKKPSISLSSLRFVKWFKETEIKDLLQFDIGLMPLTDNIWAQGKCGFKALQYMALGIPSIASPVGVNTIIIEHGVNGFLCNSSIEWEYTIQRLIEDERLRKQIGEKGKEKIRMNYSVVSNSDNFLSLFE